jgi:hypothetical protein
MGRGETATGFTAAFFSENIPKHDYLYIHGVNFPVVGLDKTGATGELWKR